MILTGIKRLFDRPGSQLYGLSLLKSFLMLALLVVPMESLVAQKRPAEIDSARERKEIEAKFYFFNGIKEKNVGNMDLAMENFRKSASLNPANDAVFYEMARVLASQSDFSKALENISAAAKLSPENTYYLTFSADLYMQLGQTREALKLYEQVIRLSPENIEAYLAMASIYENQKNYKEANKYYGLAEEKTGPLLEISQQKITNYVNAGKFDMAIKEVEKLIKQYPSELQFMEMLVDLYNFSKNLQKSEEVLRQMLEIDPCYGGAHLRLAGLELDRKDFGKAIAHAEKSILDAELPIDPKMDLMFAFFDLTEEDRSQLKPILGLLETMIKVHGDDPKSYSIYGDFLNREGNLEAARDQFRKAVELSPDKHLIWQEILNIDSRLGDFKSLKEESEKCISLFPTMPAFFYYSGVANRELGDSKLGIQRLEEGLALVLDDERLKIQFLAGLGDMHNGARNYRKSDEYYEQALRISPNDVYVLNNYSYFLSLRGEKLEKAEEMASRANALAPNHPSYQDTYAWVLYKMKKYQEARDLLEKAISGGGSSGEIFEHYGDVLYKLGETAKALEYWKKAKLAGDTTELIDRKIAEQKLFD